MSGNGNHTTNCLLPGEFASCSYHGQLAVEDLPEIVPSQQGIVGTEPGATYCAVPEAVDTATEGICGIAMKAVVHGAPVLRMPNPLSVTTEKVSKQTFFLEQKCLHD